MKQQAHWLFALSLPLIVLGVVLLGTQAHSAEFVDLENRSHALFEFDKTHHDHLPAHKLRALSLALEFGNEQNIEPLVKDLETRLKTRE